MDRKVHYARKVIPSCTTSLHPIIVEKIKIPLKNGVYIKLHFGSPFLEHNNLFRINLFKMYYFQFQIFLSTVDFEFLFPNFYIRIQ